MYHRSDLASKLILISLISVLFSACESLQTRQRRATTQEELDSHCPADFGKQEITSWKNDCNDCFCIDIMKAACTRMKCTGEHYAVSLGAEEQKLDDRRKSCVPGGIMSTVGYPMSTIQSLTIAPENLLTLANYPMTTWQVIGQRNLPAPFKGAALR
ncbi:uncharacterized protein [Bemisia tabaci]|uniref:uncharacterized protein n=1 Tax=Bemisia tabaci TaxID=7038 RepID=UPI003B285BE8